MPEQGQLGLSHHTKKNDDIHDELRETESRLVEIQRQLEEVNSRKKELEQFKLRRSDFVAGRRDILDNLRRSGVLLENAQTQAERDVAQYKEAIDQFSEHLAALEEINTDNWTQDNVESELSVAQTLLDQATSAYHTTKLRLAILRQETALADDEDSSFSEGGSASESSDVSVGEWIKRGFAFHLPLIIIGLVWIIIYLSKHQ